MESTWGDSSTKVSMSGGSKAATVNGKLTGGAESLNRTSSSSTAGIEARIQEGRCPPLDGASCSLFFICRAVCFNGYRDAHLCPSCVGDCGDCDWTSGGGARNPLVLCFVYSAKMFVATTVRAKTMTSQNFLRLVSILPFAYKRGNNPAGDCAYYSCSDCGIEILGEDVGYVGAGTTYANGEFAPCPRCKTDNPVDRDSLDYP